VSLKKKIIVLLVIVAVIAISIVIYLYNDTIHFDNKAQYQKAEELFEKENYQEAYVAFLKIKHFSKYRKTAILKQAIAAEKIGDWAIAETKYEQYLRFSKKNSFTAKAEYSLAKAHYMNKKYDKAVKEFLDIRKNSLIEDYRYASDYFLGKISNIKKLPTASKNYYFSYLKNSPSGTYSLPIALELAKLKLNEEEAIAISKVLLANQRFDEVLEILKDKNTAKTWTYLAIAQYYKNDFEKYLQTVKDGYDKNAKNIDKEDLKNFTNFYLSMQSNKEKALEDLQKTEANKVIPDYFLYKKIHFLPQEKRITEYKKLVKEYPQSEYTKDCLINIFFDFINAKKTHSAIKAGEIFLNKFPKADEKSQILFWTGKLLLRIGKQEEANRYFQTLQKEYPNSYYTYRASVIGIDSQKSWIFQKTYIPTAEKPKFPISAMHSYDIAQAKTFVQLGDKTIWTDIPFKNNALNAWGEYQKGNIAQSIYYAEKYIQEAKEKPKYTNSIWKLAYPIYYEEEINRNSEERNIDGLHMLALIREESHFNPKIRSEANAIGLMQLVLPTASFIAEKSDFDQPTDYKLQDPIYNIKVGIAYYAYIMDITNNSSLYSTGGYNGGPNAIIAWKNKFQTKDTDEFVESIPYPETKNYIKKVFRSRYIYSKVYQTE
jgi:soluble lytic murein transglycosylase-like protein